MPRRRNKKRSRTGTVLVLGAVLLVVLLCTVACAIDLGVTMMFKTQLQAAADSAALAAVGYIPNQQTVNTVAQQYASLNLPNQGNVLTTQNIVLGVWNAGNRTFTPDATSCNAVKVTVTRTQQTNNPVALTFASILGHSSTNVTASSIAVRNPRDIVFVLDLSGSMNNDSEIWATDAINSHFASQGFPSIGTDLMTAVFSDFGFGSYPGASQYVGNGNVTSNQQAFYNLTRNGGYLAGTSIPSTYRIATSDSAATRKTKGYRWIIDNQLATVMPNVQPAANSSTNYNYWAAYLDYVIQPYDLTSTQGSSYGNYSDEVPYQQADYRIIDGDNPSGAAWPGLSSTTITNHYNRLGYQTYLQFMMDYGRTRNVTGTTKVPLSTGSSLVPMRQETDPNSAGFGFSFPPREQPTHAARVAIMAAIETIAQRNAGIAEAVKDHVAIVTFDTAANLRFALNVNQCDYQAAKLACTTLQAVGDDSASTATENGLIMAKNQLTPSLNPTGARTGADKVVVLLTDGVANIKQSTNQTVDNYVSSYNATHNPDGEWFNSSHGNYRERNAAIMQVAQMQGAGWQVHTIGIGLGADVDMMDRMSRMAGTAVVDPDDPNGPRISPYAEGNPADYEFRLSTNFQHIVGSTHGALVK